MIPIDSRVEIVGGAETTPAQNAFVDHWDRHYFGGLTVGKGLTKPPVHWRLFLREGGNLLAHVAITELVVELDGTAATLGAVGGLFTPAHLQGKGYGNTVMERAEQFIWKDLKRPAAILFCLPQLVPFYARRHWHRVAHPVTLQQNDGTVTWDAEVMLRWPDGSQHLTRSIHVPRSNPRAIR